MNELNAFSKMHGLGNDFMVIDATKVPFVLNNSVIARLGHRKTGIGFDQLLVVEPSQNDGIDFNYRIFNTDGSEVEHCGNGARCFAKFVKDKQLTDKTTLTVKVKKGIITINYHDDNHIEVDMAKPVLNPADVPFHHTSNDYQPSYELDIAGQKILPCEPMSAVLGKPMPVVRGLVLLLLQRVKRIKPIAIQNVFTLKFAAAISLFDLMTNNAFL